jgi:hypothetical protein
MPRLVLIWCAPIKFCIFIFGAPRGNFFKGASAIALARTVKVSFRNSSEFSIIRDENSRKQLYYII